MELALDPRHAHNSSLADFVADLDAKLGALLVETVLDIRHGDVGSAERGAGETRCDDTDLDGVSGVGKVYDHGALASGRTLLNGQTDAALLEGLGAGELGEDNGGTVESGSGRITAVTADNPAQGSVWGSLGGGDVVAVKTHASLETEGVTSSKTGQTDGVAVLEEEVDDLLGEVGGGRGGDGDLEPILTGVAGTGDE